MMQYLEWANIIIDYNEIKFMFYEYILIWL